LILRNLDFNLSLFLAKGLVRFTKVGLPQLFSGILFKSLQYDNSFVNISKQKNNKELLFFFCLGFKNDLFHNFIPFYKPDTESTFLKSGREGNFFIDSYYTTYAYEFKFNVSRSVNSFFSKKAFYSRLILKRFKRWKRQRLFKRFASNSKSKWWMQFSIACKQYKKQPGLNPLISVFVNTSVKDFIMDYKSANFVCIFYARMLYFYTRLFFNVSVKSFSLRHIYLLFLLSLIFIKKTKQIRWVLFSVWILVCI